MKNLFLSGIFLFTVLLANGSVYGCIPEDTSCTPAFPSPCCGKLICTTGLGRLPECQQSRNVKKENLVNTIRMLSKKNIISKNDLLACLRLFRAVSSDASHGEPKAMASIPRKPSDFSKSGVTKGRGTRAVVSEANEKNLQTASSHLETVRSGRRSRSSCRGGRPR